MEEMSIGEDICTFLECSFVLALCRRECPR